VIGASIGAVWGLALVMLAGTAMAQPPDPAVLHALAPTGTLRTAINFGNPVLAQRGPAGEAQGVSVALATELVTDALASGVWDLAFLARDPVRGQGIAFTDPYVLIEGGYVVRDAAPFQTVESVDAAGVAIGVGKGSAYDLFLTRSVKHAALVRASTGNDAAAAFLAGANDALAGVKQPLAALVRQHPGLRLLPGRFMSIEQTMGTPKDRDGAGIAYLQAFIAEMKASGFVARGLAASGQHDAEVAP
jgi:polar amino acid transport system substrate-binding protein